MSRYTRVTSLTGIGRERVGDRSAWRVTPGFTQQSVLCAGKISRFFRSVGESGFHAGLSGLLPWIGRIFGPLGLPLLDLVWLVRCGVKFDEPVEGFGDAGIALLRNRRLPLFHPLVARQQQRLGVAGTAGRAVSDINVGWPRPG